MWCTGLPRGQQRNLQRHTAFRQTRGFRQTVAVRARTRPARAAIDYTQSVPVVSARAQAFYGLTGTPRLAEGRVPLQVALLSPAGRPVAITADLTGFSGAAAGPT